MNDTDSTTNTVTLRFVPEWEGQPFHPFVEVYNISNYRMQVEKLQFYLGDIQLQGPALPSILSPIELIDLTAGPIERTYPFQRTSWDILSMGLGVPEDLNHSDPTLYGNSHPLSVSNSMHWNWTSGYVFLKFEGRYDLAANSSGPFPLTYSLHTGIDTCYTTINFAPLPPLPEPTVENTTLTIRIAVDKFFHSPEAGIIDLENENLSHGMNVPLSLKLTHNVVNSFTLD